MPTQVKVGLILTLGGLVGLIVSLYFKLDAAVIASANVQAAGAALLGKEWFQQSPEAQTVYSKRPPPPPVNFVGIVLMLSLFGMSLLAGCGAEQAVTDARDHVAEMRERSKESADRMRSDLSMARGVLDAFSASVDTLCGFRRVPQCDDAADAIRVLESAHKAASTAVDTVESTGLALDSVTEQVAHVVIQARVLGETVRVLGQEVANAVAQEASSAVPAADSGRPGEASADGT